MASLFISLEILLGTALLSFVCPKESVKRLLGCWGVVLGCGVGAIPSLSVLIRGGSPAYEASGTLPWLDFRFGIDALSAFFLMPVFVLSAASAVYALGYLKGRKELAGTIPFFPLLVASMAAVITARDGFLFLICWEVMSLASFFLVCTQHSEHEVRQAGWIYLAATHLAAFFLMAFFVILSIGGKSFAFVDFVRVGTLTPGVLSVLILCAFVGFGTKAGLFPLHVWLPHAHPAAPSYISALMSGVMIKTGVYGIFRMLTFIGTPPLWSGILLTSVGIASAVFGVLYALMQEDIKKLLAYSSVENVGIIAVGIGMGMTGMATHHVWLQILGFSGALFHVWNHAVFKGLLFLGAGNVVHAAGTRNMGQMGGLAKIMPRTATMVFVGCLAVCALPPLNGFVSEWLIYLGLLQGAVAADKTLLLLSVAGILGVALAGGLALASFTKFFGLVFLGLPRGPAHSTDKEAPALSISLGVLAGLCLALGLFPQALWPILVRTVQSLNPGLAAHSSMVLELPESLQKISLLAGGLLLVPAMLFIIGRWLWRGKPIARGVTWDCGYAAPTPRMQYSGSSFAQPLASFFRTAAGLSGGKISGLFPGGARCTQQISDPAEQRFYVPVLRNAGALFAVLRRVHRGHVQYYLSLIFLTLIGLILWEVWIGF